MNEEMGLPTGNMKTVKIAVDVDGTLRCNCTETCQDPNERIVELFKTFSGFKNTDMYVWSGGGANYALRWAERFGLPVKAMLAFAQFMDSETYETHTNQIVHKICYHYGLPEDEVMKTLELGLEPEGDNI